MGSPLNKEDAEGANKETKGRIESAAGMLNGNMNWYWSKADGTAKIKGGIGTYGLDTSTFSSGNIQAINIKGVDHSGPTGWWGMEWLQQHSVDLSYLVSRQTARNAAFSSQRQGPYESLKDQSVWMGRP